jgi:hypothetical protein
VVILHPNLWLRSALLYLRPVVSKKFWRKLAVVESVEDLRTFFDGGTLLLPRHVFRCAAAASLL